MTLPFISKFRVIGLSLASLSLWTAAATAQDKAVNAPLQDKSQYNLFNPTPTALMREMNTDRPDTTESPYTVDAGHFQIEMSLFDFERSFEAGSRTDTWALGQMNLKAGLWDNTDLQVIFDTYTTQRTTGNGIRESMSGFSDVTIRVKTNLWGNEGGKTALGLIPYVGIPTRAEMGSDRWGGGLIVPFSISFSDRYSLSLMIQADLVPDAVTSGYDIAWVHSASFGISLTEKLGSYLELVGIADAGGGPYQAFFDAGLTYSLTDNLMVDTGVRLGLNNDSPEVGAFTGISIRF